MEIGPKDKYWQQCPIGIMDANSEINKTLKFERKELEGCEYLEYKKKKITCGQLYVPCIISKVYLVLSFNTTVSSIHFLTLIFSLTWFYPHLLKKLTPQRTGCFFACVQFILYLSSFILVNFLTTI